MLFGWPCHEILFSRYQNILSEIECRWYVQLLWLGQNYSRKLRFLVWPVCVWKHRHVRHQYYRWRKAKINICSSNRAGRNVRSTLFCLFNKQWTRSIFRIRNYETKIGLSCSSIDSLRRNWATTLPVTENEKMQSDRSHID